MGLATVLPKGDRGEVGRPGRQGITGPPVKSRSFSPQLEMSYSRALEDPLEAGEKLDQRAKMGNRGRGGLVDQKACR